MFKLRLVTRLLTIQIIGDGSVVIPYRLFVVSQSLEIADPSLKSFRPVSHQEAHRPAGSHIHVEEHRQLLQGRPGQPQFRLCRPEGVLGAGQPIFGYYQSHPGLFDQQGQLLLLGLKLRDSLASILHLVGLGADYGDVQHGDNRHPQKPDQQLRPLPAGDHEISANSTGVFHPPSPPNRTVPSAASFLR